jgi:hypothetical protein
MILLHNPWQCHSFGTMIIAVPTQARVSAVPLLLLLLLLQGVKNVADACKTAGSVSRVVLVSSMLTHLSNR